MYNTVNCTARERKREGTTTTTPIERKKERNQRDPLS
jgi:hypothetical protein